MRQQRTRSWRPRPHSYAFLIGLPLIGSLSFGLGCGSDKQASAPPPSALPEETEAGIEETVEVAETEPAARPLVANDQTWTPEELEALLAPIALYPDPVMTQVLMAASNPQEVLDAGNWLIANPELEGGALDEGAKEAGFTPPMRAIMQFRPLVDQMCLEMGWTTELGQAFTNDETGVLEAVQRLRQQAKSVGNLKSSEQMKVETKTEQGKAVIITEPPSPEVVYVPTYDPVTAYAPPPEGSTTVNNTTVVVEEKKGPSTGAMVATGVLSFGVGLAIGSTFNNDPYYYGHSYYYPNYHYGRIPPPPPYYYRPVYGHGYAPSYHYQRPPSYNKVLSDNKIVVVNNDRRNNNYWNGFDDKPSGRGRKSEIKSPISAARPNRPELTKLNADAKRRQSQPKRQVADTRLPTDAPSSDWKGRSSYAGAKPEARKNANLPAKPASQQAKTKAASNAAAAKAKSPSSVGDRGYAGNAKPSKAGSRSPAGAQNARPQAASNAATRAKSPATSKASPSGSQASRPSGSARPDRAKLSSGSSGASARAASERGRSSMPKGTRAKTGKRR